VAQKFQSSPKKFLLRRKLISTVWSKLVSIGVARFFFVRHTKIGQINMYAKRPQNMSNIRICNIPNGHKMYQHFPFYGPPKYTQIWIVGMKISYHLASLVMILKALAHKIWQNITILTQNTRYNAQK
jgi:hypothetical protein